MCVFSVHVLTHCHSSSRTLETRANPLTVEPAICFPCSQLLPVFFFFFVTEDVHHSCWPRFLLPPLPLYLLKLPTSVFMTCFFEDSLLFQLYLPFRGRVSNCVFLSWLRFFQFLDFNSSVRLPSLSTQVYFPFNAARVKCINVPCES